jgi:hypothetical protein
MATGITIKIKDETKGKNPMASERKEKNRGGIRPGKTKEGKIKVCGKE